jgi:hypothetical protein
MLKIKLITDVGTYEMLKNIIFVSYLEVCVYSTYPVSHLICPFSQYSNRNLYPVQRSSPSTLSYKWAVL